MIPFNKLLPEFFLPLGISFLLIAAGVWRGRCRVVLTGLALLLLASHPITAWVAMRSAEGWVVRVPASSLPTADAVVVLSYGRMVAPGVERVQEWHDPDRFFGGVALMNAGKAPRLVFTAAHSDFAPGAPSEAQLMSDLAVSLGVPAAAIRLTARVETTADEAAETLKLLAGEGLKTPTVILVTTAWHLPRATQQFEAAGVKVYPFAVDFRSAETLRITWSRLLPTPGALVMTHTALRELYGRWYYRLREQF